MARVTFKLDAVGMAAFLATLPPPMAEAEDVAQRARDTAPYSDREEGSEHYRDSIDTGEFFDPESKRRTAYVEAGVSWASKVEVIHRTLGRALDPQASGDGP